MNSLSHRINWFLQNLLLVILQYFYRINVLFSKKKPYCRAIFAGDTIQIFCDGSTTCSCRDNSGTFQFGNIFETSFDEIWNGKQINDLRHAFRNSRIPNRICSNCNFFKLTSDTNELENIADFPNDIFFENTARCNLRCFSCKRESIHDIRTTLIMPFDKGEVLLKDLLNQGKTLKTIHIIGQGEPFLDPHFSDYVKLIKKLRPDITVSTSTNGLVLNSDAQMKEILLSGVDSVTFSIDGANQTSYEKYQIGGEFEVAYQHLKRFIELRNGLTIAHPPLIVWQYIFFRWNDSLEEIKRAQTLAREAHVDQLAFQTTFSPILGISLRRVSFVTRHFRKILGQNKSVSLASDFDINNL